MATASPNLAPTAPPAADASQSVLGRVIDLTTRAATSWLGATTAYIVAVSAAVVAFQALHLPLPNIPVWQKFALVAVLPVLAFVFHTIPMLIEQRRKKRLAEITGHLQPGYFRMAPREDEASFMRADNKHEEIFRWLDKRTDPILYMDGLSGSGKSSLLAAWVLPKLARKDTLIINLRGYQDPVAVLEKELQKPGIIWQKPSSETTDTRSLLERACKYIRPKRLLVVLDQFEEFVILQDADKRKRFEQLLSALRRQPIPNLTFLFVFRSEYIGIVDELHLPPFLQDTNWKRVPPFTERAARDFMQSSGLQVSDRFLRDVLHEAAEIEQTEGIIRPVTINLCGLVLGRFAGGLPRGFRPGSLIRGFLRESILLPPIRDIAPVLVPHLITSYITKQPRTIAELANETTCDPALVRGCLRTLGQSDRAIVRPLDVDQQTWEISHDFLVPLLDSILGRWRRSLWRRFRAWLPWVAAVSLVSVAVVISSWRTDPIAELTALGWRVKQTDKALELTFDGPVPKQSIKALRRISQPLSVNLSVVDSRISEWRTLKNLSTLNLSRTQIVNVLPLKDLKSLSTIDLSGTNVSDVSPLTDLEYLSSLNLSGTNVSDVTPLANLTKLTKLDLSGTNVSDVSPLTDLEYLSSLSLSGTNMSDVTPLAKLTKLTELDLSSTNVNNVAPLADLTNLSTLYLRRTEVSDVSPLKNLRNLSELDLSGDQVSDVSPLKDLSKLTSLYLDDTKVSNLSPLKDLKNLSYLELWSLQVRDVSPLKDLKKLSFLILSGTKVSNLSPLKNLKDLSYLFLSSTQVRDVSPLKGLMKLRVLHLDGTKVSNLSPLENLKNLSTLDLNNTRVSDVSPVKDLMKLRVLYLDGTKVSNLLPLKNLKDLSDLFLSGTKVSNVSPLENLKNLSTLDLHNTLVSNLQPLRDMKQLSKLDLSGTQIRDVSPLKDLKELRQLDIRNTRVSSVSVLKQQNLIISR